MVEGTLLVRVIGEGFPKQMQSETNFQPQRQQDLSKVNATSKGKWKKKNMKFAAWSEWDILDYMNIQNSKKSKIILKKEIISRILT